MLVKMYFIPYWQKSRLKEFITEFFLYGRQKKAAFKNTKGTFVNYTITRLRYPDCIHKDGVVKDVYYITNTAM